VFREIKTIQEVVDWGLCIGCGACYYACSNDGVRLFNIENVGIRPKFESDCSSCNECLEICPGFFVDGDLMMEGRPKACDEDHEFGQTLEIWEAAPPSNDPTFSFLWRAPHRAIPVASSRREWNRWSTRVWTRTARGSIQPTSVTREDVLARTGSRYNAHLVKA
jgi:coenzyme F420 hydrogenase subunit beta